MKKNIMKSMAFLFVSGLLLAGCNGLGKMAKNSADVTFNVDPSPLIVRGDSVELNITGTYPAKYFSKKATVAITPSIVNDSMTLAYRTVNVQGEDAPFNYKVIPYDTPSSYTFSDKMAYEPALKLSNVVIMAVGAQGKKTKDFAPISIGLGVRTTPYLMQNDDMVVIAEDHYQRITKHQQDAVINYLINKSIVRRSELKDIDMLDLAAFIADAGVNERILPTGINIKAWASPDGELSFNDELANERAASAQKEMEKILNANGIEVSENFFNAVGLGEDWEGFKLLMQASVIEDKDLIIRILEMYSDKSKREQEIKNLAATYLEIAKEVLPLLRRSEIQVNFDYIDFSDEEIMGYIMTNPDTLELEQMLYAATLTNDLDAKLAIYMGTAMAYPTDYRAANNAGVVLMLMGKVEAAKIQFELALLASPNPISSVNLGAAMRQLGDREVAMDLLKEGASAGPEAYYNMGLIDIQNGNYASAITNFGSFNTFNVALVKMLNGDNEGASRALNSSADKDSPMGFYLAGIIAARNSDEVGVMQNLQHAVELDPSIANKAAADLEFYTYWNKFDF